MIFFSNLKPCFLYQNIKHNCIFFCCLQGCVQPMYHSAHSHLPWWSQHRTVLPSPPLLVPVSAHADGTLLGAIGCVPRAVLRIGLICLRGLLLFANCLKAEGSTVMSLSSLLTLGTLQVPYQRGVSSLATESHSPSFKGREGIVNCNPSS